MCIEELKECYLIDANEKISSLTSPMIKNIVNNTDIFED